MDINKESIFDTRPWKIYGEGQSADASNPLSGSGFNEGKVQLSEKDIRFNQKGNTLYATVLGVPLEDVRIKSLGKNNQAFKVKKISVLGSKEKLSWKQEAGALIIEKPKIIPNDIAIVFKIEWK
jgi:alpha-L-fucosidase